MLPLSDREKRWGWAILLGFLLCITLPYAWAWAIAPPGFTWGGLLFSTDDQNVHLMWARQARDGAFFMRDLFTTEGLVAGTKPLFVNGLMLLIGWLSRASGVEVVFWYHIVRVAGAAWALWQLHLLSWEVTGGSPDRENARLATLALAAFTTGTGVIALALPQLIGPIVWIDRADNPNWPLVPEAFIFLSALIYPLNIVSFGLLTLVLRHVLNGKWFIAFAGALLLSNLHTYDALPLILVAAIWAAWQWKSARPSSQRAVAAIAGATIPIIYQIFVFRDSEEFRVKALTPTTPPSIWMILIAFLFLLLLSAAGFLKLRDRPQARNLMVLWAVGTLVMVYAPLSFGRKMLEGLQIPLLMLAGVGLAAIKRAWLMWGLVAVLAISPLITLRWILNNAANNNIGRAAIFMPPIYLYNSDVAALHFIENQPQQGAVLCLPIIGGYVPRVTGKYTYAGHWAETLYMKKQKMPATLRYISGQMSPDQARQLFAQNDIRWVLEGPYERAVGGISASQKLGLRPVFRAGEGENQTVVYAAR